MELFENKNIVYVEKADFSFDGSVTITLSDERRLKLATDKWMAMDISKEKALSHEEQLILEKESCYIKIREKMLSLLTKREHSAFELRRKIRARFYKSSMFNVYELVERCLLEMQERNFQSDERFASLFVESKINNNQYGPFRILQDLHNRGISREMSEKIMQKLSNHDLWIEKALNYLERYNKKRKDLRPAVLSQKLYQRGFSWETIEQVIPEYQSRIEHSDS